ncbi:MAG: hypothetical protein ABSE82_13855 [Nitrososphaerales archaeon]|jgi:stage III sporulation protein SpoIIIAA
MTDAEAFQQLLSEFAEILKKHTEQLEKLETQLRVHRNAIASFDEHPEYAEEQLRGFEESAVAAALSDLKFQQSDAMMRLLRAGKKLDEPDA